MQAFFGILGRLLFRILFRLNEILPGRLFGIHSQKLSGRQFRILFGILSGRRSLKLPRILYKRFPGRLFGIHSGRFSGIFYKTFWELRGGRSELYRW